ncbi:MAG: PTS IIA-like nitrogen regulatory protein PtsN [Nitratireductor sp.]|nr:PTS IIA-like nitrogen regulatory protein PtsN [Nitratireductor sp.]MCC0022235.1 PTS IIA-like nitrogen regulatory protein PtsN [Nitratireductor sp.]
MDLTDLISQDDVLVPMKASSKKQLLSMLADAASKKTGIESRQIFDTLLQRERLGSTGVGNGIAIPHGKLPGLEEVTGIFARLDKPIDFEAQDDQPVDVVFLLLASEEAGADHLKALSRVARLLRTPEMVQRLRNASDASAVWSMLSEKAADAA